MLQSKHIGYQSGLKSSIRDAWVAQGLSLCLWLRVWSWSLGSSPILGSWWGACFSLCLIFCLSLSLTIINNIIIKKQHPSVRCLKDAHLRPIDTNRLKVRGWKIIYHANGYQKKAGGPILISDKRDLKPNPGGHMVAQWLSICLRLRVWSCDPRIESHISLPLGSLPLTLLCSFFCFSVYLSWIYK